MRLNKMDTKTRKNQKSTMSDEITTLTSEKPLKRQYSYTIKKSSADQHESTKKKEQNQDIFSKQENNQDEWNDESRTNEKENKDSKQNSKNDWSNEQHQKEKQIEQKYERQVGQQENKNSSNIDKTISNNVLDQLDNDSKQEKEKQQDQNCNKKKQNRNKLLNNKQLLQIIKTQQQKQKRQSYSIIHKQIQPDQISKQIETSWIIQDLQNQQKNNQDKNNNDDSNCRRRGNRQQRNHEEQFGGFKKRKQEDRNQMREDNNYNQRNVRGGYRNGRDYRNNNDNDNNRDTKGENSRNENRNNWGNRGRNNRGRRGGGQRRNDRQRQYGDRRDNGEQYQNYREKQQYQENNNYQEHNPRNYRRDQEQNYRRKNNEDNYRYNDYQSGNQHQPDYAQRLVENQRKYKAAFENNNKKEQVKQIKKQPVVQQKCEQKQKILPRGQKCWPQTSIYISQTKLTFSYRQITEHQCDILIIPYRDLTMQIYPGNIINKCKVDYREKIHNKGSQINQNGYIYTQKCIGISNFKAIGFLKIGNDVNSCIHGILPQLTKLKLTVMSVLIPYSKHLGNAKQFISIIIESVSKSKGFSEVHISTNNVNDFKMGMRAFNEKIQSLIDGNKICIDY